jgi:hypothetical protein
MHALNQTVQAPLHDLPYEQLCPGAAALDELMNELEQGGSGPVARLKGIVPRTPFHAAVGPTSCCSFWSGSTTFRTWRSTAESRWEPDVDVCYLEARP